MGLDVAARDRVADRVDDLRRRQPDGESLCAMRHRPGAYRALEREDHSVTRKEVVVERRGDIAVLVLNRPTARNAVNAAMAQAIVEAVAECQDAGAIVLTGADPAF